MTETPLVQRAFTPDEMLRIERIVDQAPGTPNVIMFVHKLLLADNNLAMEDFGQGELDPTQHQIPADQWEQIAGWIGKKWNTGAMLSWMNSGPSQWVEAE